MHEKIKNAVDALNSFVVFAENAASRLKPDSSLIETRANWQQPAMSPNDLVQIPKSLALKIEAADIKSIDGFDEELLDKVPGRLAQLQQRQNVEHLFNGNAGQALAPYLATMNWLERLFDPVFGYENLNNPLISKKLKTKIAKISNEIDSLEIEQKGLSQIVDEIKAAHETAEDLPTDLAELSKAKKAVDRAMIAIDAIAITAEEQSKQISDELKRSNKLLEDSEKTYSKKITEGLSGAFYDKARTLTMSMWVWVLGLIATLILGVFAGKYQINKLMAYIQSDDANMEMVVIQIVLSLLILGGPLWFAWLSTKQIGHRFKLAEDYSYKASTALAYEGFRREASRIDPIMEAKLLFSALNRFDEAPLRYIEEDRHETPFQELIS